MSVPHLKDILTPLVAARAYAPWSPAPKYARELRVLQRRVAAARLGIGWPRRAVRDTRYEDLR